MSIIVVSKTENQIKFAWDSQLTYCDQPYDGSSKVFTSKGLVVGISTDNMMVEKYLKSWVSKLESVDHFHDEMSLIEFIDKFKSDMRKNDLDYKDSSILISNHNLVFYLHLGNYTCYEVKSFEAIGSGATYAIGAYYAGASAEKSVECACEFNIYCGLPVNTLDISIK